MTTPHPIHVLSLRQAEAYRPFPGEVCLSITNPSQSPARLNGWSDILRLGFHDTDWPGGNFTAMSQAQAGAALAFFREHRDRPITVHCEYGGSRSVACGLFAANWLGRPLLLFNTDVLQPNPWVVRQLRRVSTRYALRWMDWALARCALAGLQREFKTASFKALPHNVIPNHPLRS